MPLHLRPRRLARAALTVALVAFVAACGQVPNSIFHPRTDVNREVGHLFDILIWAGTITFVLVEVILLVALYKFRHRPGQKAPAQVHGNTTLEITWTVIPAVILIVIAIPTVRAIFNTQAKARADALQVEVIGHQWWWEFRYPQYNAVTANELYLPIGRTVNFSLKTQDVIHSFWIAALSGKRDLISNRTNYLWFTPDSVTVNAFNGVCVEYCGASHANMRFKAFTVTPEEFASWAAHQATNAAFTPAPPTPAPPAGAQANAPANAQAVAQTRPAAANAAPTAAAPAPTTPVTQAGTGYIAFPKDSVPAYAVPHTPLPAGLAFDDSLQGDPTRGAQFLSTGQGACLACHTIKGNPMMVGLVGPNLTHVGSRTTIAAGLYPNDAKHLARWIKNARVMKPGVLMPTLGLNEYDPILKAPMKTGGLTDQQIADIVAYLQALK